MRKCILLLILFICGGVKSQGTLLYSPKKPAAGDTIKFTYTLPSSYFFSPEAYVVKYSKNREQLFDVSLEKRRNTYTGKVITDSSMNLIVFSFKNAGTWDNNNHKGNFVYLKSSNGIKEYAYSNTAHVFDFYGPYKLGLKKSDSAAVAFYENEFSLFPANRDRYIISYLTDLKNIDLARVKKIANIEIDLILAKGLESRKNYDRIQQLYSLLDQPEKAEFYKKQRIEKIPFDKYIIEDLRQILLQEKVLQNKEQLLIEFKAEKNLQPSKNLNELITAVSLNIANVYLENKNWPALKRILDSIQVSALIFWKASQKAMLDTSTLDYAKYFALKAVNISKKTVDTPGVVPNYLTYREFIKENKATYGSYLDNYASILLLSKEYAEALPYTKEATLVIAEGNNVDYNSHYATIISKTEDVTNYRLRLESFIKNGKEDDNIISLLKFAYDTQNKTTISFDAYLKELKDEAKKALADQLRNQKINSITPPFELKDVNGEIISLSDYKGKTLILDFWATWCAPCVASFPAMNDLVQRYKNDSTVAFLFINTLQSEEGKLKVVNDFIRKNNYEFKILIDDKNLVAQLFEVNFIPLKIVIGKDGKIKFKSIGFKGADLLKKELSEMILESN
jgi:thiol-disulfide isomerase/thioredoxin